MSLSLIPPKHVSVVINLVNYHTRLAPKRKSVNGNKFSAVVSQPVVPPAGFVVHARGITSIRILLIEGVRKLT